MRFAFVSIMGGAPWAACEELWAAAARQALADGHEVFVSVNGLSAKAPQIQALQAQGARVEIRPAHVWVRRSALIARLYGIFRTLRTFNADAICISQGGTYDVARSGYLNVLRGALQTLTTPYVLLCHCEQPAPERARKRRARSMFGKAAVVGVLAENLKKLTERHLDMSLRNARVFQNPLKLTDIRCYPWPPIDTLRLAFVGRLEHVKGLDLLIDALSTEPWRKRAWQLTVCGAGVDRAALESRCQSAHLTDRVSFAGFVTDITSIWKAHHVLVMPSRFEGIPIALTEAMLCGRPAVATDIGGIGEVLLDGETGFLIQQANEQAVASALERLWANRAELQAMGRAAFEAANAHRDENPGATLVGWLAESASRRS